MALLLFLQLDVLIERLDDESIEVRDAATEAIIRLGEPALPALRALTGLSSEKEARVEFAIRRIAREVRRRTFKGGEPVSGLSIRIAILKPYRLHSIVEVEVEVMNVDPMDRPFVPIRGWDCSLPDRSQSSSSAHAKWVLKQTAGRRPSYESFRFG